MTKKECMVEALAILLWKSQDLSNEYCSYEEYYELARWLIDHGVEVPGV